MSLFLSNDAKGTRLTPDVLLRHFFAIEFPVDMFIRFCLVNSDQNVLYKTIQSFENQVTRSYLSRFREALHLRNSKCAFFDSCPDSFNKYMRLAKKTIESLAFNAGAGAECDDPVMLGFLTNVKNTWTRGGLHQRNLIQLTVTLKKLGQFDLSGKEDLLRLLDGEAR